MAGRAESLHAVILAGGAGERFWPASRRALPKPFLRVAGGRTLLEATVARARRFAADDRIWVVCGEEHRQAIRTATGLPARRVLAEPRRRNTAMAVGFAAARLAAEDPDSVFVVLPADHVIPDERGFAAAIRRAARGARKAGSLVTIGVEPRRPDTGLGYIQRGTPIGASAPGLHRVRRFVEKPDARTARRYLRQGGYLWNAGIFVWSSRAILEEIEAHAPDVFRSIAPLLRAGRRPGADVVARCYRRAPSVPIDTAVMEKSRRVWTLPVRFHWNDVGTWASLAEELGVEPGSSKTVAGELFESDAGGNLVWSEKRAVALLGVEGLAVIDTDDALLVARLDDSPKLRELVAKLKAGGREDLT